MAERWGKISADFHDHPKVIAAGLLGRAVFVFAICQNRKGDHDGRLPRGFFGPNYLARQLGVAVDQADEGLQAAMAAGLLGMDDTHVYMLGWCRKEWGLSKSTERVREHRSRICEVDDSETPVVVSETCETVKRPRGEERRGEKGEGAQARKARLPDDWIPNAGHHEIAKGLGVSLDTELANFRDHALANGRVQKDWDASFRTWLRRSPGFTRGGRPEPKGPKAPPLKLLGGEP